MGYRKDFQCLPAVPLFILYRDNQPMNRWGKLRIYQRFGDAKRYAREFQADAILEVNGSWEPFGSAIDTTWHDVDY